VVVVHELRLLFSFHASEINLLFSGLLGLNSFALLDTSRISFRLCVVLLFVSVLEIVFLVVVQVLQLVLCLLQIGILAVVLV
jgi:hypothetical protein